MLNKQLKRLIAVVLTAIFVGGSIGPTYVYAAIGTISDSVVSGSSKTVGTQYVAREATRPYAFPNKDSTNLESNKGPTHVIEISCGSVKEIMPAYSIAGLGDTGNPSQINDYKPTNEKSVIGTSIKSALEDCEASNASSVLWTGDSSSQEEKDIILNIGSLRGLTSTYDTTNSDSIPSFVDLVLTQVIDDLSGTDSAATLDEKLNHGANSIGASSADITNLNQRMASALFHYINWFSDVNQGGIYEDGHSAFDTNAPVAYSSIDTISDPNMSELLNNTLALGHTESIQSILKSIGVYDFSTTKYPNYVTDVKKCGQAYYPGSINALQYMGVLSVDCSTALSYNSTRTLTSEFNEVVCAEYMAALICLTEYLTFYRDNMVTIANTSGWQTDTNCQASLFFIKKFHDAYGSLIPVVETVYHMSNPDANNKSIYDMVAEVQDSISTLSMTDAINMISDGYVPHTDTASPINQFYTVNSKVGIVSYDRDTVLNDSVLSKEIKEKNNQQYADNAVQGYEDRTTGDSNFLTENTFLSTQSTVAEDMLKKLGYNSKSKVVTNSAIITASEIKALPDPDSWEPAYDDAWREFIKTDTGEKAIKEFWDYIHPAVTDESTSSELEPTVRTLYNFVLTYYKEELNRDYTTKDLDSPETLYFIFTRPAIVSALIDIANMNVDDLSEYIKDNNSELNTAFSEIADTVIDYGVSNTGNSSSYASVTMNEFITRGMGYSANYIPMQTNVYSSDLIQSYIGDSADEKFYNMYMNYGFMRKALLIDTSATSAMDFYNANGTLTNSTRVCTLSDLIDSGDNDIALYVDSNFYNADDAITQGNEKLDGVFADNADLIETLNAYVAINKGGKWFGKNGDDALNEAGSTILVNEVAANINDKGVLDIDKFNSAAAAKIKEVYQFDVGAFADMDELLANIKTRERSQRASMDTSIDEEVVKTGNATAYQASLQASLSKCPDYKYINVSNKDDANALFLVDTTDDTIRTDDNSDSIVLSSMNINHYLCGKVTYNDVIVDEAEQSETTNTYTVNVGYSPLMSLAYVSCLYRDVRFFSLANVVEHNNPVFLASDDLVTIDSAPQWYKNTLLNYMLIKNIKGNAQIDINYATDLNSPVYIDIFGNILTESGTVVVPAACNATLHTSSFNQYNYAAGLYTCYGSNYYVPSNLKNATLVIYPFFVADNAAKKFIINGYEVSANGTAIRFDKLDTYDEATRDALTNAYMSFISNNGEVSRLNWIACVKIVNEVMRGAPIEYIDKKAEGLSYTNSSNTAGLVAAAKLESLMESLNGTATNSLLCIPDFARMDNMDVIVALFIKLLIVATAAVIIISIYRDGVSGTLGPATIGKALMAIALTVSVVVVIPSVFQLTYYSANKALLDDEALSILMVNEEKRQGGIEIGVTKTNTVESNGEFALQLDWISVPWYEQLEKIIYGSTLDNLQEVKQKAYEESPIYNNSDVTVYNDGVYVTTDSLFDSVLVDFDFLAKGSSRSLKLIADPSCEQTASYYTPYYVFLRALVENVNDYNTWFGTSGKQFSDLTSAQTDADLTSTKSLNSYNYSTKMMSGNRKMTVGLSKSYFESEYFMQDDDDILRLMQIYCGNVGADTSTTDTGDLNIQGTISEDENKSANLALDIIRAQEANKMRSFIFSDDDRNSFRNSYWYNTNLITFDTDYYEALGNRNKMLSEYGIVKASKLSKMSDAEVVKMQEDYVNHQLSNFYNRVEAMNGFARDFVAKNKNMLGKVTDETFLKVMALAMSIKYNQLFGVPSANSLEIYNMDSMDLMRLCIVPAEDAVMASTMSYPRFTYAFGGEASIYMSAVLAIILWIGSYIKPLCTIIVFISVFISIFVFKVVLRKPSANLIGYLITTLLLCATNLLHALVLKIGVALPNMGLSTLGCLIFIVVGQVAYLLVLAYVTGISLKDWSNLGAAEYSKEADLLKSKLRPGDSSARLSGSVKHHDDNWDYYNDLINQHRSRNASGISMPSGNNHDDAIAARNASKYDKYPKS